MARYIYEGPVEEFNVCIAGKWTGETVAASVGKAKSNLAYQYKKEHKKTPATKITLPGKLTIIG